MRTTDWAGNPPETAEEAESILLNGALECAKHFGLAKINIKRVAEEVGVTRQTVYRYYPSSEALITAVSTYVVSDVLSNLTQHINEHEAFGDKIIESIIFLVNRIPSDPYLSQYFSSDAGHSQKLAEVFSPIPLNYSYEFLKTLYPYSDLSADEEKWLKLLAEHILRVILSLIITPSDLTRSPEGARCYLDQILRPVLTYR